ncbi:GPM1B [Auxenochlorella protothecoides x Auxenochlorella symbiontica]|uniref:phosphoglycerate mutase (2,3-diphosphoglycerate-independent) n=2 Tax=Auxenochlorella protothecoides TaxID=3075 RepID=A0A087SGT6_AUXPR|nr:2,3-bisphosphoglycerate-independent phosphoglycerate mutase [Auxenochlorella protothecoides]KFM24940.1 2,3-bisphosphoglycerate-independent phosphoglycerate mutase [Auxenochlorella protothecoides]RMZ52611.1 hypothetical protein APUTEX25_000730 [Auxenochlorella protothecoides]|eukprot:RMZ52611.1 hypothetical protein APUTEX25_000730 [Auxenochlorella protothecoides]
MVDFTLKPHPTIPKPEGPLLVCIMDGWGVNVEDEYNAVHVAETPTYDAARKVPGRFRSILAHGTAVGLPSDADMGNSEVGHNALGAGQVIDQGASLVDKALASGSIYEGEGWAHISEAFAENTLHLIGLLSDGGVHSRTDQLFALVRGAADRGAKRIRVHVLTDGRDVPDGSSVGFAKELEAVLAEVRGRGVDALIASGGGRMCVTMDRYEADWEIVRRGWAAHVLGEAPHTFPDAVTAITTLRAEGSADPVSDQWLDPFVIVGADGEAVGPVRDGDAVAVFNFRADRVCQISKAFEYEEFAAFDRVRWPRTRFVGLMQYDGDLKLPARFLVPPPAISGVSGEVLARNGLRTFACSETQKYGHVTFFWNGNRSGYFDEALETYVEVPSDRVPFNQLPLMKAREICEAGKEALRSGRYDTVRINFANPDMVGHTGDLAATVEACACVDAAVGELLALTDELGGRWLLTSDHGNADDMVQRHKKTLAPLRDEAGQTVALTSHTLAPVPLAVGGAGLPEGVAFREDQPKAGLANVAATIFNLLGYEAPGHMEPSLLKA